MENMGVNPNFWNGKRVFLTGHTGFKGSWLTIWLKHLGAEVHGYALSAPTEPNIFGVAKVEKILATSTIADVRDANNLTKAIRIAQPEIVFHMAAQSLVRHSYNEPVDTYSINVMGTVNLLEAVRNTDSVRTVVNITTDKCYENREWVWPYRESEAMGGYDPYSSSKACSELVTAAYRRSFLEDAGIAVASARAGNVIGGGDWAVDRLIPDFLRAIDNDKPLIIRSPNAVRPWQHVLEPLSGYMLLAEKMHVFGATFAEAWNFGPDDVDARPVQWIAEALCKQVPGSSWRFENKQQAHEATTLRLDSSKAKTNLGWQPCWNLETALMQTIRWHQAWKQDEDMSAKCIEQIRQYTSPANQDLAPTN